MLPSAAKLHAFERMQMHGAAPGQIHLACSSMWRQRPIAVSHNNTLHACDPWMHACMHGVYAAHSRSARPPTDIRHLMIFSHATYGMYSSSTSASSYDRPRMTSSTRRTCARGGATGVSPCCVCEAPGLPAACASTRPVLPACPAARQAQLRHTPCALSRAGSSGAPCPT